MPWDVRAMEQTEHAQMKKSATQSRKQTLDLDPADHIAAGAGDNSGTMGSG